MDFITAIIILIGLSLVAKIYETVSNYVLDRRAKKRDEIARKLLDRRDISTNTIAGTDELLKKLCSKLNKNPIQIEDYEIQKPSYNPIRSDYICPSCKKGYLVPRNGRYGVFLGCNSYPICSNTKPIDWVNKNVKNTMKKIKEQEKNKYLNMFIDDLNGAYK